MTDVAVLSARDLHKSYREGTLAVDVLRGAQLDIMQAEIVAVVGASGSGKSTLLHLLGGLDAADRGAVVVEGRDLAQMNDSARGQLRNERLGFVYQFHHLLPEFTALDNVAMPLTYTTDHLSEREARRRAAEMLARVGLQDRMDHEPSRLSGGQQQRVAIARALINRPPLLLADEPTGNLDSRTSEEVLAMFQVLNQKEGITIIMVTHDANVALYAQRVIRIHDGMIVDRSSDPAGRHTEQGP